jgi:hypothetical protein
MRPANANGLRAIGFYFAFLAVLCPVPVKVSYKSAIVEIWGSFVQMAMRKTEDHGCQR